MQSDSNLYVLRDDQVMIPLEPISFDSEDEFQALLERFPELIPGDQIDRDDPRRWLLVGREIGVPDNEDGQDRWALDHLFLDQDGIPTLVEVKRHTDSRIRREVVGQMMDYAANAVTYWPADRIQRTFVATSRAANSDPDEVLTVFLGDERDPADFWATVHANLRDGNVRLVFVADRVPYELQRIVEFLNERISPTEVLAVEIQRYAGGGLTTHVPRVFGQTIEAQIIKRGDQRKMPSPRRKWNEDLFFEDATRRLTPQQIQSVRMLYERFRMAARIDWGTGQHNGSFNPKFNGIGNIAPITIWSGGEVQFKFSWMDGGPADKFRKIYHRQLKCAGVPVNGDHRVDTELKIDEWSGFAAEIIEATKATLSEYRSLSEEEP